MRLKKIEIKNYRSIKEASIELDSINFFVGKNDAGKSNILKALDLFFNWNLSREYKDVILYSSAESENEFTAQLADNRLSYNYHSGVIELTGEIEISENELNEIFPNEEINVDGTIYRKTDFERAIILSRQIKVDEHRKALWKTGYLKISLKDGKSLYITDEKGKELKRVSDRTYSYTKSGMLLSFTFLTKLQNSFVLIPASRTLKKEVTTSEEPFPSGEAMPSYLLMPEKPNRKEVLNRVREDFCSIFPEYAKIYAKEDSNRKSEIFFDSFSSSSVGDGARQVFMTIFNLNFHKRKIVAIEEPEIHLHFAKQEKLLEYLKKFSGEMQIIVTTHSHVFKNGGKFYFVKKENGETKFREMKGKIDPEILLYDHVILGEGESKIKEINSRASDANLNLLHHGIKTISFGTRKEAKEILSFLREAGINYYFCLDEKDNAEEYVKELLKENLLSFDNWTLKEINEQIVRGIISKLAQ